MEQQSADKMIAWLHLWEHGQIEASNFNIHCRTEMNQLWAASFLAGMRVKRPWRDIILGRERVKVSELLKTHFGFWEKFYEQLHALRNENKPFGPTEERRMRAYTLPARASFEWALVIGAKPGSEFYWDLKRAGDEFELGNQETCGPCRELHARSPLTREEILFTPGEGRTPCLVHCTCHIRVKEPE